jgi:hypothetical protein
MEGMATMLAVRLSPRRWALMLAHSAVVVVPAVAMALHPKARLCPPKTHPSYPDFACEIETMRRRG